MECISVDMASCCGDDQAMDKVAALSRLKFFQGLPEGELRALAEGGLLRTHAPGEVIVSQDEEVRSFYLVVSGRVKIFKVSPEGREQTLYVFGPGEPFCLCSTFSGEPFPANAAALEQAMVFALPSARLEKLAQSFPTLMFDMLLVLSRRLKESMLLVESLSLKEVPERVAAFLVHAPRTESENGAAVVDLGMTHRELAKIVGATPEALSRAFRRLADQGLAEVRGRKVRLPDPEGLAQLAESG